MPHRDLLGHADKVFILLRDNFASAKHHSTEHPTMAA